MLHPLPSNVQAIKAKWLLTQVGPPLENATLIVRDGRIEAIELHSHRAALDLGDHCILPRFINSHTHFEFSSLEHPLPAQGSFANWIASVVQYRRSIQPESPEGQLHRQQAYRRGLEESSSAGVGLAIDMVTPPWNLTWIDPLPSGTQSTVWPAFELLGPTPSLAASAKSWCTESLAAVDPTSPAGLSPHAPYTTPLSLVQWAAQQVTSPNAFVSMHLAESDAEVQWMQSKDGPLQEMLDRFADGGVGFTPKPRWQDYFEQLAKAPKSLIAHGNFLQPDDWDWLAQHRDSFAVVFCPRTHAHFQWPSHPWPELRKRGVPVFLGTDSRASNPNLNILEEAAFLWHSSTGLRPETAMEMITVEPAAFLDAFHLAGRLAPGDLMPLASIPCQATKPQQVVESILNAVASSSSR